MSNHVAEVRNALTLLAPQLAKEIDALAERIGPDAVSDADRRRVALDLLAAVGVPSHGVELQFGWTSWSRRLTIRVTRARRVDPAAPLRAIGENETPMPARVR